MRPVFHTAGVPLYRSRNPKLLPDKRTINVQFPAADVIVSQVGTLGLNGVGARHAHGKGNSDTLRWTWNSRPRYLPVCSIRKGRAVVPTHDGHVRAVTGVGMVSVPAEPFDVRHLPRQLVRPLEVERSSTVRDEFKRAGVGREPVLTEEQRLPRIPLLFHQLLHPGEAQEVPIDFTVLFLINLTLQVLVGRAV